MKTKILTCNCQHAYQDDRYGKGRRVFNAMGGEKADWRCTVCKREVKE